MIVRFSLILLLLAAALPLQAQNNPFGIDDECYEIYERVEGMVGTPTFDATNAALYAKALEKKDKKAETLYYVQAPKHLTHKPHRRMTRP